MVTLSSSNAEYIAALVGWELDVKNGRQYSMKMLVDNKYL